MRVNVPLSQWRCVVLLAINPAQGTYHGCQVLRQYHSDSWSTPNSKTLLDCQQSGRRLAPNDAVSITDYNNPPILLVDNQPVRLVMPTLAMGYSPTLRMVLPLLGKKVVSEYTTSITVLSAGGGGTWYPNTTPRELINMNVTDYLVPGWTVEGFTGQALASVLLWPTIVNAIENATSFLDENNILGNFAGSNTLSPYIFHLDDIFLGTPQTNFRLLLRRPGQSDRTTEVKRYMTAREVLQIGEFYA